MFQSTDCILIMGRRRCGKSYLAGKISSIFPRRVIFDTLGEYSGDYKTSSFLEFCEALKYLKENKIENFVLVHQFDPESEIGQSEFNQMLRLCYYFGNIHIVIEECHIYSSPHFLPHWMKNCFLTGRHQGLSILVTTQRPAELNKTILSQCAHVFCGTLIEGNDIRYVSAFLNKSSEALATLPERSFIHFSASGVKTITT